MEIINRKASHDYFIKKIYECGIELVGTEIKSIRTGSANINDSYIYSIKLALTWLSVS